MRTDKKKKGLVIVLLLIAVLVLGVGYAAITNVTLNITGQASATSDDDNFDVNFIGTPTFSKLGAGPDANIVVARADEHNATIQVSGLKSVNEYVTGTYTIKNVSPEAVTAALSATVSNNNPEYFEVTYVFDQNTIAQNAETTVTVTVKLIKVVVTTDQSATIGLTIDAAPQNA